MIAIGWVVVLVVLVGVLVLGAVMLGGFLMFRGKQGAGFFTEPKGEVFSIPDATSMMEAAPESEEEKILSNTERFLNILGGKDAG